MAQTRGRLKKTYSVFDCDAHINDPEAIWNYVEPQYREVVRQSYWRDDRQAIVNGGVVTYGGGDAQSKPLNYITTTGPGVDKKLLRRLRDMPLTPDQKAYLVQRGAYDGHARLKEMALMGIDQVLIIPTMVVAHYPFIRNHDGAYAWARAYNNWAADYCSAAPDRLFPAGWLPLQNPVFTVEELHRIAAKRFPVALIRPIDANGNYPNKIFPPTEMATTYTGFDPVFRTFEETGIVVGMHTFPWTAGEDHSGGTPWSPGELIAKAGTGTGRRVDTQTFSFIFESMTWVAQVLLSGFLDRYPKLKMAIFESNASWLPGLLGHCDRLFQLYGNERRFAAKRLPSEAFSQQCMIAFESDEVPVYRQWQRFEHIGVWSSDSYHNDAAEAWDAIRKMEEAEVPEEVQGKLMGGNARRFYGIEGKLYVTEEYQSLGHPGWYPQVESEEFRRWWERESHPRKHAGARA